MVSKNQIKLITSLRQKKFRQVEQLFFAEGVKTITELLASRFELTQLYQTSELFPELSNDMKTMVSEIELKKISALHAPNNCLAVFKIPDSKPIAQTGLILALDDVRDPGNLGTILRLCDWFGVDQLICSEETVDLYNPKVIQATMGSIARVAVHYSDLKSFITQTNLKVYGTFMEGENIYHTQLPKQAIIVMGNEANGISPQIEKLVAQRIAIPRFGSIQETESLNVATAVAITLSEFRRN